MPVLIGQLAPDWEVTVEGGLRLFVRHDAYK
jgi:hypothetical protein